jgi:hypothetical protein
MDNLDKEQTKECRRCGVEFTTRSRIKKRCDPCQDAVEAIREPRYPRGGGRKKRVAL